MHQIVIKEMTFSNILAYGDNNRVVFDKYPVVILDAKNGFGKSSLATILEECLYNKNSRGFLKTELQNIYSDKTGYSISVTFVKNNDTYVVDKQVKASAKLTLTKNGENISSNTATATYKQIEEILGMNFETFSKLVYQGLDSNLDFLTQTDAKRRDFLVSMLDLGVYSDLEKAFKEERESLNSHLKAISKTIDMANGWLANTKSLQFQEEKPVPEVLDVSDQVQNLQEELSSVMASISSSKAVNSAAEAMKKASLAIETNMARLKKEIETLGEQQKNLPNVAPAGFQEILESKQLELNNLVKDLSSLEGVMKVIKTQYQTFRDAASQTECPTCKRPLDISEAIVARDAARAEYGEKTKLRTTLVNKIAELTPVVDKMLEVREQLKTSELISNKIAAANKQLEELSKTEVRQPPQTVDISDMQQKLTSLQTELNSLQTKAEESRKMYDSVVQYNHQVEINNTKAQAQLEKADEYKKALDDSIKQMEEVSKELKEWDIIITSVKPVINYQIESCIKVFEDEINKYLVDTSDGAFYIRFSMKNQKLEVELFSNSIKRNIKTMSSGEKVKIQIATLLAIRDIQSATGKSSLNIIFLDELISALDPVSKDSVVELLLPTGYNSIMVSHGYSHPLAITAQITRENSLSKLWLM